MQVCLAQNTPKVSLDTSETLFTVLTAINACGYDQELGISDPLRGQIRSEVAKSIQATEESQGTAKTMCEFYREHQQPDSSRDLAQYVSLALSLNGPPFAPKSKDSDSPKGKEAEAAKAKEANFPPDASYVAGFIPLMQKFYETAGLQSIWQRHREAYSALTDRYHEPVSKMLFAAEMYLKLPSAGYLGRQFTVYLDAMGAPGQTNARNYGTDYYVVISPGSSLKMQQIRHTYLHYLLDPLALKNGGGIKRLEPLLDSVKSAPMDDSFKSDISLLVTECLVRAIEARTMGSSKTAATERAKAVDGSVQEGFILTRYFYDALAPAK